MLSGYQEWDAALAELQAARDAEARLEQTIQSRWKRRDSWGAKARAAHNQSMVDRPIAKARVVAAQARFDKASEGLSRPAVVEGQGR